MLPSSIDCLSMFELSKTLRHIPDASSAILAVNAQSGLIFSNGFMINYTSKQDYLRYR